MTSAPQGVLAPYTPPSFPSKHPNEMQFEGPSHAVAAAIRSIFERWTALILTIEHQCGGAPDRARQLLDRTVAMATNPSVRHTEQSYIDMFYAVFDSMDTDIEDGSPEQIAAHIIRVRDGAARGDFAPAIEAVQQSRTPSGLFGGNVDGSQVHSEEATVGGGVNEIIGAGQNPSDPIVDEDGFTEVRRSRRNRQ